MSGANGQLSVPESSTLRPDSLYSSLPELSCTFSLWVAIFSPLGKAGNDFIFLYGRSLRKSLTYKMGDVGATWKQALFLKTLLQKYLFTIC